MKKRIRYTWPISHSVDCLCSTRHNRGLSLYTRQAYKKKGKPIPFQGEEWTLYSIGEGRFPNQRLAGPRNGERVSIYFRFWRRIHFWSGKKRHLVAFLGERAGLDLLAVPLEGNERERWSPGECPQSQRRGEGPTMDESQFLSLPSSLTKLSDSAVYLARSSTLRSTRSLS